MSKIGHQLMKTTMAESEKKDDTSGGWWGSWISAAKEKTEKALEMVSQDLAEFTSTMQTDTKKVVDKTKETLQANEGEESTATDVIKKSFHSLMTGITKVLTVEPEDTSPSQQQHSQLQQHRGAIFDRAKARLRAIQVDTGTYLREPSGSPQLYADWLRTFDLDKHKGDVSELLVTMVEVRSLYTTLVPSEVSHQDFWRRYFYKLQQLEVDEARKQALMKRAERAHVKEDSIGWDEEEEWSGDEDAGSSTKGQGQPSVEEVSARLQPAAGSSTKGQGQPSVEEVSARLQPAVGTDQDNSNTSTSEKTNGQNNDINSKTITEEREEKVKTSEKKPDTLTHKTIIAEGEPGLLDKTEVSENKESDQVKDEHKKVDIKASKKQATGDVTMKTTQVTADQELDNGAITSDKTSDNSGFVESGKIKGTVIDLVEKTEVVKATEKQVEEKEKVAANNVSEQKTDCDIAVKEESTDEVISSDDCNTELKTQIKGDMVVVGDRISPSSESSKATDDDWEDDLGVDISAEDIEAARTLATNMNMSAADYSKLTGDTGDDDWENWE